MLFCNGRGEVVLSEELLLEENAVSCVLWEQLLCGKEISIQIQGIGFDNGEVVTEPYTCVTTVADKTITLSSEDDDLSLFKTDGVVLVDYYTAKTSKAQQIEITPDKFGGNYYLEASTLFRDTNGIDLPADFIIPNCKIQSNFTFSMASSGDPSTFTFTMDAFPDYTRFNKTKKVLALIQIVDPTGDESGNVTRPATPHTNVKED
jgi:hypothetical protein